MNLECDTAQYRVLIIDDNHALHDDFRKILTPEERHIKELTDLESDLFGSGDSSEHTQPQAGITFKLDSAYQGKDGFEMVQIAIGEENPYALAFVDMRMPPGWDGLETIEHLWRAAPDLQIVVCTAYSDHSWSEISNRLGSTDQLLVLKKPFDRIEIVQASHALVKKWCLAKNAREQQEHWDAQMQERAAALEEANQRLANEKLMLERMQTRLQLSQKLEAVGQLAAGVAHEINTPIQYVGDNLVFLKHSFHDIATILRQCQECLDWQELLKHKEQLTNGIKNNTELDELIMETSSAFEQAQDGVRRVTDIALAMKEFAHPGQSQKTLADINRALSNTLAVAKNEYKYIADIKTDFGEIPNMLCSISDINQVFLNIMINAAHAIYEASKDDAQVTRGLIHISSVADNEYVTIKIRDNGCGISADIADKVFDPFFTTKEIGRGTGQGLAIAKSIVVDKHGGEIYFESDGKHGTTFTVKLPLQVRNIDIDDAEFFAHDRVA